MLKSKLNNVVSNLLRFYSNTIPNEIKIPKKIFRTDLSILKALAGSVEIVEGLPPLSIMDDPYYIASDFSNRRRFYLSRASGRKTAQMVFNQMGQQFVKLADEEPKIKCLTPVISVEDIRSKLENEELSIDESLSTMIRLLNAEEAWKFFEENSVTDFSNEVLGELLQLMCVTCGGESSSFGVPQEQLWMQRKESIQWTNKNSAELLFAQITEKTDDMYRAVIRGSARFNDGQRAVSLYEEYRDKFGVLDLVSYNALLGSIGEKQFNDTETEIFITKILQEMADNGIQPDRDTFQSAFKSMNNRSNTDFVLRLWREMQSQELDPSLGTWALLIVAIGDWQMQQKLVEEVLQQLEDRKATIVDYEDVTGPDDFSLFVILAKTAVNSNNIDIGLRLHKLATGGGRFHLLGNDPQRALFVGKLCKLLLQSRMDVAAALDVLAVYVPHYFILQANAISIFIQQLQPARPLSNSLIWKPDNTQDSQEDPVTLSDQNCLTLLRLMDLVHWSDLTMVNTNSYASILKIIMENRPSLPENIRGTLAKSLRKILICSMQRPESAVRTKNNPSLTLALLRQYGLQDLLWDFMEYFTSCQSLTPLIVQEYLEYFFLEKNFDRMLQLTDLLIETLTNKCSVVGDKQKKSLEEIVVRYKEPYVEVFYEFGYSKQALQDRITNLERLATYVIVRDAMDDIREIVKTELLNSQTPKKIDSSSSSSSDSSDSE